MMNSSNNARRRGLGKGLGALIADTSKMPQVEDELGSEANGAAAMTPSGVQEFPIHLIQPNPQQPRSHFDETALQELANSIRTHGILQPLIITQNPTQTNAYWLVAGERRWRAARLAELTTVPAIVREASTQQLVEWALIENVQRADLNPLEEALAYKTLLKEFGLTQDQVAERVGKSRPAIANLVRLLESPHSVQKAVTENQISAGHARALLALKAAETVERALSLIVENELNVRQTEALVKRLLEENRQQDLHAEEASPTQTHPDITFLENRFRAALGTRVNLNRGANGAGRLVIHFYNDDDLTNLLQLIAGDHDL